MEPTIEKDLNHDVIIHAVNMANIFLDHIKDLGDKNSVISKDGRDEIVAYFEKVDDNLKGDTYTELAYMLDTMGFTLDISVL